MRLRELVRKKPITIESGGTVYDVIKVMAVEDIGFIVVTEAGRMVGVLSERDVIKAIADGKDLNIPVGRVCKRDIITLRADATLEEAAAAMGKHRIRHVVVVDDENNLVGVVSVRDILAELYSAGPAED
ncbi:MAG TPA: CBS domain-containing protein [Candidatus Caldiarchaeum subterraneum]|uniref:CBS domain-containing protein n=1 Tax=Caldiarchaeum subterraneum TaxID=311458 RepID=A0A833ECY1_CALS0|nr:CBS domain-containing protein [Aigarchaeota archaeon]HIQ30290.1 CBS domain-containing protein [Candidatus Caldarchaeum subterraneum]